MVIPVAEKSRRRHLWRGGHKASYDQSSSLVLAFSVYDALRGQSRAKMQAGRTLVAVDDVFSVRLDGNL